MKPAHDKIRELKKRIEQRIGIELDFDIVAKLRRIEIVLHRNNNLFHRRVCTASMEIRKGNIYVDK